MSLFVVYSKSRPHAAFEDMESAEHYQEAISAEATLTKHHPQYKIMSVGLNPEVQKDHFDQVECQREKLQVNPNERKSLKAGLRMRGK